MKLKWPGPFKWVREKIGSKQYVSLVSTKPAKYCPNFDRVLIAMREDFAQFPYAGTEEDHRAMQVLRAVNNFDSMLDALEAAKALMLKMGWAISQTENPRKVYAGVSDAIAKAKP